MPAAYPVQLRAFPIAGLALAATLAAGSPAEAAPQVLGLVADAGGATELVCDGFQCAAQFSSFCLQEARSSPATGTPYAPAVAGGITLVAAAPDGRSLRLPASEHLRITTLIGFTSISMSLPEAGRARLAAALGTVPAELELTVEVGPDVSLVPVPEAGDPDPQTNAELALATGPMRRIAGEIFEAKGAAADAARLTTLVINALPVRGQETPEERLTLFDQVVAGTPAGVFDEGGVQMARGLYAQCRVSVDSSSMFSMRECLRLKHADLMARSNRKFWEQSGGS